MAVGHADFFRIIELLNHGLPFFLAMVFNHSFFLVIPLQIHAHSLGIGLRMKLCSHHIGIKPNGHDGPFQGYMGPLFLNAKQFSTNILHPIQLGLDDLEVAAVHNIKGIAKSFENWFI